MTHAALYVRVSTASQAEKHGTRYQRDALMEMAKARGWHVVNIYADEGVSGRKERRPGLDALMRDIEGGGINLVAVWRFDRFARSLRHLVNSLNKFRSLGVDFVSHQEGLDTATPMGMCMFQISAAMSELESNLARERINAGIAAAKSRGIKFGRKRQPLTQEQAVELVCLHGSMRAAAAASGYSATLIFRRFHGITGRTGTKDAPAGAQ